jgi:hypothetical protein
VKYEAVGSDLVRLHNGSPLSGSAAVAPAAAAAGRLHPRGILAPLRT